MYIHGTTRSSLGFHVLNNKERFSSYNYVEHLKWRWSNLYKPRSKTYIGKNVKLAWNLKEKNYKVMKPNLCTWSTFPWRGEERKLSYKSWRWKDEGISWWRPWRVLEFSWRWWRRWRSWEKMLEERESEVSGKWLCA